MKKLLLTIALVLTTINLTAQPIAKTDTIFYSYRLNADFKTDTIKYNILANDKGKNIKIIEYSVDSHRYVPNNTIFRSCKNFGKIRLTKYGECTFVTIKQTKLDYNTKFVYTINDGRFGTSQTTVHVLDSAYLYMSDSSKIWVTRGINPYSYYNSYGYYYEENGLYYIKWINGDMQLIDRQTYLNATEKY